jgi:hypothetical protein
MVNQSQTGPLNPLPYQTQGVCPGCQRCMCCGRPLQAQPFTVQPLWQVFPNDGLGWWQTQPVSVGVSTSAGTNVTLSPEAQ